MAKRKSSIAVVSKTLRHDPPTARRQAVRVCAAWRVVRDGSDLSGDARPRDRDVGIGIQVLLLMARRAVLVACHSYQDQNERQAKEPTDNCQHDPSKAQIRHSPIWQIRAYSGLLTGLNGVTASKSADLLQGALDLGDTGVRGASCSSSLEALRDRDLRDRCAETKYEDNFSADCHRRRVRSDGCTTNDRRAESAQGASHRLSPGAPAD